MYIDFIFEHTSGPLGQGGKIKYWFIGYIREEVQY